MHRLLNVLLYTFDKHVNYTIVKKYVYMGGNIYIYTCIIPLSPLGSLGRSIGYPKTKTSRYLRKCSCRYPRLSRTGNIYVNIILCQAWILTTNFTIAAFIAVRNSSAHQSIHCFKDAPRINGDRHLRRLLPKRPLSLLTWPGGMREAIK